MAALGGLAPACSLLDSTGRHGAHRSATGKITDRWPDFSFPDETRTKDSMVMLAGPDPDLTAGRAAARLAVVDARDGLAASSSTRPAPRAPRQRDGVSRPRGSAVDPERKRAYAFAAGAPAAEATPFHDARHLPSRTQPGRSASHGCARAGARCTLAGRPAGARVGTGHPPTQARSTRARRRRSRFSRSGSHPREHRRVGLMRRRCAGRWCSCCPTRTATRVRGGATGHRPSGLHHRRTSNLPSLRWRAGVGRRRSRRSGTSRPVVTFGLSTRRRRGPQNRRLPP